MPSGTVFLYGGYLCISAFSSMSCIKNADDWPKGFIPQMYHLLQEYGLLHEYLDIDPVHRSVADLETDVAISITEKVLGIVSDTPLKTYDFRISFLNKLSLRLSYVNSLRLIHLHCCNQDVEDGGKRKFRLTLEYIQRAIDGNKRRQKSTFDKSSSPENTDSDDSSEEFSG